MRILSPSGRKHTNTHALNRQQKFLKYPPKEAHTHTVGKGDPARDNTKQDFYSPGLDYQKRPLGRETGGTRLVNPERFAYLSSFEENLLDCVSH